MTVIHPIEAESYRIIEDLVDLSAFGPTARAVVARIVHATADVEYVATTVAPETAAAAAVDALRAGAPVVCDVEMVRHGITAVDAACFLDEAVASDGLTRSAAGIRAAARRHGDGAVWVVGCAPTPLEELISLVVAGDVRPGYVVGLPVGFVGAAESKEALRASGLPAVSNVGVKGGSAVAAAACNALVRLAKEHR